VVLVAGEILSDGHGGVVRGFRDNGLNRIFDRDGLSWPESELGRRLFGGVLGGLQQAVELELAGYDLGQRGRMAWRSGFDACSAVPLLPSTTIEAVGGE
jgi:hypothetical protein